MMFFSKKHCQPQRIKEQVLAQLSNKIDEVNDKINTISREAEKKEAQIKN